MSVVRIEALRALGALIESRVPELAGRVCVGVQSEHEEVPNLSIQPSRWMFDPEQADENATLPGNVVVWHVGIHSCPCVLSIVTATPGQRAQLEAKVLDLFMSAKHPLSGMPLTGVILLPVTACPQLGRWTAGFDLESDEWSDALALDRRLESRIVANATIPALTIETPVYTIEQLRLGVTEDTTTTFTAATAVPPVVELVTINEDGTITRT